MDNEEQNKLKAWVLRKLGRSGYWGRRLTDLDNIPKGAPKHLWGEIKKSIVPALLDDGFLTNKTGVKGMRYSLNSHKKLEIIKFVDKYYPGSLKII